MAKGFVSIRNLNESDSRDADSLALNNLGGDGTSRNLALFSNNNQNVSVLKPPRSFNITSVSVEVSGVFVRIVYECDHDFVPGMLVDVTGIVPSQYNKTKARVSIVTNTTFQVLDSLAEGYPPVTDVASATASGADYVINYALNRFERNNDEQVIFTNKTKVTYDEVQYTVEQSDGENRFKLVDDQGNEFVPSQGSELKPIIRKDLVTLANLSNLRPDKLDPISRQEEGEEEISVVPLFSGSSEENLIPFSERFTIQQYYDSIYNNIDKYLFRRKISVVNNDDVVFDVSYNTDATITIENVSDTPIDQAQSPGLYIASGDSAVRAFSDNSNPWSQTDIVNNGYNITNASKATIRNLVLTDPNFEDSTTTVVAESNVMQNFTHKLPVRINDGTLERTFFILLTT